MFERSGEHTASLDRGHLRDNVGRYLPTKNLAARDEQCKEEIERRRQRAIELEIPKIFKRLYMYIRLYPTWIHNPVKKKGVPSLVTSADSMLFKKKTDGDTPLNYCYALSKVKIGLNKKEYVLTFEDRILKLHDGSSGSKGILELFSNNEKSF